METKENGNPQTALTIPEQEINNSIEIYRGASTLKVSDEEQTKLLAAFPANEIEIRPDGLIFLPQTFWRKRLNTSFGIGQWCLIVKGQHKDPTEGKDKLYLQGILMVRGCYVAEAIGEAELHSDNPLQSWASVWESAKSDCITRCCKDLGIASELWQPQFIQKWVSENAVRVWREKTGKRKDGNGYAVGSYQWRKKTAAPFYDEKTSGAQYVPKKETTDPVQQRESTPVSKGEDTRPWLNDNQYKQALQRINGGNLDVYHKTVEQFRMKRDYKKVLDEAYELSKSFIQ